MPEFRPRSDFYISERQQASDCDLSQQCETEEDRVQSKRITALEPSMLAAILDKIEWGAGIMGQFEVILVIDDGARLIQQVSPALVDRLSSLKPEELGNVTKLWAQAEEIACAPEDIQPLLENLKRLAIRAQATKRHLFLWNCV